MNPEAQHLFEKPQRQVSQLVLRIGLGLFILMPSFAQALEFQCELNGDVRQLSVLIPGDEHLCEVSVDYESRGDSKVMWHADNDSLFCSAKAYALVGKYEDAWGFSCAKWPDRDGVDELSPTQRSILDLQLRKRTDVSASVEEPATVIAIKATASTPLDDEPGTLAIQYFLSDGRDLTEIIAINDNASWSVFSTIEDMASQITGAEPIDTALISTVTDSGTLEVVTSIVADDRKLYCHGRQVLTPDADANLSPRTPHRTVCQARTALSAQPD